MSNQTIVLASTSPFRKELLARLELVFTVAAPNIDEQRQPQESPQDLVTRLAEQKASAVAHQYPDALIIGSDQVAVLDQEILGKPGDHDNAVAQLTRASGKEVKFFTGLCLLNTKTGNVQVAVVPYSVHFRTLTHEQIDRYLHFEKPYHCAGSFKSEGLGIVLFERLQGDDPSALIGLPLITLTRMLEKQGYTLL